MVRGGRLEAPVLGEPSGMRKDVSKNRKGFAIGHTQFWLDRRGRVIFASAWASARWHQTWRRRCFPHRGRCSRRQGENLHHSSACSRGGWFSVVLKQRDSSPTGRGRGSHFICCFCSEHRDIREVQEGRSSQAFYPHIRELAEWILMFCIWRLDWSFHTLGC